MATRFFCDVCGDEMTAEDYRAPRPYETKVAVPFGGSMCPRCVKAFASLNVSLIVKNAILEARKGVPVGRVEG